jgi:hypothetical protein
LRGVSLAHTGPKLHYAHASRPQRNDNPAAPHSLAAFRPPRRHADALLYQPALTATHWDSRIGRFLIRIGEPRGFVMGAAIGLRQDFSAEALRAIARRAKDGPQARRLVALAAIYDGATRSEAAKIGGVTLQIVRDANRTGTSISLCISAIIRIAVFRHSASDWNFRSIARDMPRSQGPSQSTEFDGPA